MKRLDGAVPAFGFSTIWVISKPLCTSLPLPTMPYLWVSAGSHSCTAMMLLPVSP